MSNKNAIAHTAAALEDMEKALEATRQAHPRASTTLIETKVTNLAEVVRNTRRKMNHPAGFDWAMRDSFKVVSIGPTHLRVEAKYRRGGETDLLDIPRSDLSLSTWQVTSTIRRLSAESHLATLNATVTEKRGAVADNRKEVAAVIERLLQSDQALLEAKAALDRRVARLRSIEAKREATRARRQAVALAS